MNCMKILITQETFPPDITGGAETLTLKIIQELIKKGHTVEVICTGDTRIKEYKGIKTTRISINRYLANLALPTIFRRAKDADIIHTSSGNICLSSWTTAKLLKKPIVCYVHHIFGSNWKDVRGRFVGRIFQAIERFYLVRDYNTIVFQNKQSKKLGLEIGIDEKRIFMLQPGIDYKKFQMKNVKKEPFVLFVGNFSMDRPAIKIKGLEYLIEAAKRLPDVKFVIVGGGSSLDELKKKSSSNVVFTGPLVGKPLIEMYNKALVFCLPSLTEGFGITVLEAMASECAIVSTIDIGQEGVMIKANNVDDIVNGVNHFIENPNVAKKIGRENRRLASKFTWNRFINNIIQIYEKIL